MNSSSGLVWMRSEENRKFQLTGRRGIQRRSRQESSGEPGRTSMDSKIKAPSREDLHDRPFGVNGHRGRTATSRAIDAFFYWDRLEEDVIYWLHGVTAPQTLLCRMTSVSCQSSHWVWLHMGSLYLVCDLGHGPECRYKILCSGRTKKAGGSRTRTWNHRTQDQLLCQLRYVRM